MYNVIFIINYDEKKPYGPFQTERDAVRCAIQKAFQKKLISRKKYIIMTVESITDDDGNIDVDVFIKMKDDEFKKMVCKKVMEAPTKNNLEELCFYYSDYGETWSIKMEKVEKAE